MTTRWMPAAFALAGLIALTGLTGSAKAGLTVNGEKYTFIDPRGPLPPDNKGPVPQPGTAEIVSYLSENDNYDWVTDSHVGTKNLWKWNDGTSGGSYDDEAAFANLYEVVGGSESGGTIQRTGTDGFNVNLFDSLWLVVKDGNEGFVVYDLLGAGNQLGTWVVEQTVGDSTISQEEVKVLVNWNGFDAIKFDSPFSNGGKISNVSMWGTYTEGEGPGEGPVIPIPEPATSIVWLISACLCGLFIHRRVRRLRVA